MRRFFFLRNTGLSVGKPKRHFYLNRKEIKMAIHWQIKFKSLRAAKLYTVNVYDSSYSGTPVQLIGAEDPFYTQEDDSDDMFTPIRTQSGYLRIVDDGTLNWRSFIPTTDIDRPVTLTATENGQTVTLWQGFMQAENFGADLYGNPQERSFPLQCVLTVTQGQKLGVSYGIHNFAYLLKLIIDSIPEVCRPNKVVIQGGYDAQAWLLKCLDWQNFMAVDEDYNILSAYYIYNVLEYICRFWGWTARTYRRTLYLTCADDSELTDFLVLTHEPLVDDDLETMASGTADGTIASFSQATINGNFADTDNVDYQMRGANYAEITSDPNDAPDDIINPFDEDVVADMNDATWDEGTTMNISGEFWHYTKDLLFLMRPDLYCICNSNYASLNILYKYNGVDSGYSEVGNVLRIKQTYNGNIFATFNTLNEHSYQGGFFRILADTYRMGDKYENGNFYAGNPAMKMRLGIGPDRSHAQWWNGRAWVSGITTFLATIGNKKPELFTRYEVSSTNYEESSIIAVTNAQGYLYVDILGTDDSRFEDVDGKKAFDLKDFRIEFTRNGTVTKQELPNSHWNYIKPKRIKDKYVYKSSNANAVQETYSEDNIFCSDRNMKFGYGIVLEPNGNYMVTAQYNGSNAHPEQHKANRITDYWANSKRKIEPHLLTHNGTNATTAEVLSPQYKVTIDGTQLYPVSISRRWRDDVAELIFMEI